MNKSLLNRMQHLKQLGLSSLVKQGKERFDLLNESIDQLITTVFVELPLALPVSATYCSYRSGNLCINTIQYLLNAGLKIV